MVRVRADSQVFRVAKSGAATPASVTINADLQNLTGNATFSITGGTLTGTGNARTLTYANMSADTAVVTVTHSGLTDKITIVKVREGSDGTNGLDGLTVIVSNEAHTVPASSTGAVSSYTNSGTTIQVYEGITALTAAASATANGSFTIGTPVIAPAAKITVGPRTYSGTTATVAVHSAMDAATDSVVITYPITVKRLDGSTVTLNRTQTITKSKAGVAGANSVVGILSNESHSVPADNAGVVQSLSGAATTMTVFNGTADDSANWTYSVVKTGVTCAEATTSRTQTVTNMTADVGYVDFTASRSGYANIIKRFTVTKSKAGSAGGVGSQGAMGPTVTINPSRAATFTATDGALDNGQLSIVFTATVTGIASPTYTWSLSGFQTAPTASTTASQTVTAAQFGTAKYATVTCTVNPGGYKDTYTIVRLEKSTAEAWATVGADSSNLRAGPGVNMVFNGDYTDGLAGTTVGWRSAGNQHVLGWNLANYFVQGEGTAYIMQPGTPGAGVVFDANIWNGQSGQHFAVTPGKKYEISAWLNCHRCEGRMGVLFLDAAGAQIQQSTGSAVTHQGSITSIADMRQSWATVTAPATAVKAVLIVRGYNTGLSDPYVFFSRIYFGEAGAGQTEPSLWTPGRGISQITPSNVTTYIANAAIGAAQIGSIELVGESAFKVRTNNSAGARMDMDSRRIKIFDASGALRVQLGDLTA